MFRVSLRPSSGVPKTVTATSGIGYNIGAAASFQCGLISEQDKLFSGKHYHEKQYL
jgi:hypothetical protein